MSSSDLEKSLIDRIGREGQITFADFMEAALYDPSDGYYTSGKDRVGFEGDFITSPAMSPAFGMTLSRLMPLVDDAIGHPDTFHIVELGAGEGKTAKQILDTLQKQNPDLYSRTKYICVERNPTKASEVEHSIEWREEISDMEPVRGVVISNELFDALPVHRVVMREGGLREIMVTAKSGKLADIEADLSDKKIGDYFRDLEIELAIDQEAEVCLAAKGWIERIASVIDTGMAVSIDYGYPASELYARHRKRGTLLAYYHHKTAENFYGNIGEQDLTAHVNFTALVNWGKAAGLDPLAFTDQLRFFLDLGIHEVFAQIEADSASYSDYQVAVQPAKSLIMPGGMGETFKVLLQYKGLGEAGLGAIDGKFKSKYAY